MSTADRVFLGGCGGETTWGPTNTEFWRGRMYPGYPVKLWVGGEREREAYTQCGRIVNGNEMLQHSSRDKGIIWHSPPAQTDVIVGGRPRDIFERDDLCR